MLVSEIIWVVFTRFSSRNISPAVCSLATVGEGATISMSVNIDDLRTIDLSVAASGLVVLVKTQGAADRREGGAIELVGAPLPLKSQ